MKTADIFTLKDVITANTNQGFLCMYREVIKLKCTFRAMADCRMPKRPMTSINCQLCLMGQHADEIGLLTSAVMNLSIEKTMEAIHKEEYE